MVQMNAGGLYGVLRDFYILTGNRIGIMDKDFQEIMSYPAQHGGFCALVHKDPEGARKCAQCDREGCGKCAREKTLIRYRCHAGLTEVFLPVFDKHGVLAYIGFGQIVPREEETAARSYVRQCYPRFSHLVDSIPAKSAEEIDAAATILQTIVAYVMTNHWIAPEKTEFIEQLDRYIKDHLDKGIGVDEVCAAFCIGRTQLYKISMDYLGCALSEYIRRQRVYHAQEMLKNTAKTVTEIACDVGFSDYNHFSRLFKKYNGCSAREYRLKYQQGGVFFE